MSSNELVQYTDSDRYGRAKIVKSENRGQYTRWTGKPVTRLKYVFAAICISESCVRYSCLSILELENRTETVMRRGNRKPGRNDFNRNCEVEIYTVNTVGSHIYATGVCCRRMQ